MGDASSQNDKYLHPGGKNISSVEGSSLCGRDQTYFDKWFVDRLAPDPSTAFALGLVPETPF